MGIDVTEGDSLFVIPDIPAGSVDAVITDSPYSSGGAYRGDRTQKTIDKYISSDSGNRQRLAEFAGDTRDQRGFRAWCTMWIAACWHACRDGAVIALFSDWRQLPTYTDALQAGGFVWRGIAVWDKTEATRPQIGRPRAQAEFVVLGQKDPAAADDAEYVLWGSKGPLAPYPGAPVLPGVFRYPPPQQRFHIAEKPIPLLQELVKLCPPGGLVLDPFAGTGPLGIACAREGRAAHLVEIMPGNVELIRRRLEAEAQGIDLTAAVAGQLGLQLDTAEL